MNINIIKKYFFYLVGAKFPGLMGAETLKFPHKGEGIVLPAHRPYSIKPNGQFKRILTVIKSGYE